MPAYNTQFQLDLNDLDRIETALRTQKKELSMARLDLLANAGNAETATQVSALDAELSEIHELLGRLHNQKVFYRPGQGAKAPYISG